MALVKVGTTFFPSGRVPKEVVITGRGIISPKLAKEFFPSIPVKEVQAAARRQVKAQEIREAAVEIVKTGKTPTIEEFKEKGVTVKELEEFGLVKDVEVPPPVPPPVKALPPPTITIPKQITPLPEIPFVTAPGAIFPSAFPRRPEFMPDIFVARPGETPFERAERKKARRIALEQTFEEKFRQPLREKLAPIRRPLLIEKIREPLALAVGEPLSLIFGPKEIREETAALFVDFPEEITKPVLTAAGIVAVPPTLLLLAGAPIIKKFREKKFEEALGLAATQTALIGTAIIGAKVITKARLPKPPFRKPLKAAAKPTLKLKKKVTVTEKRLLAQLIKKAKEPPKPPRITNVIRKDGEITIIVKSAGKVVETRRLIERITPKSVIEAQLRAAKLQGAKFSGIQPPTALPRFVPIPSLAVSKFDVGLQRDLGISTVLGVAVSEKERQRREQRQLQLTGLSQLRAISQKEAQAQKSAQKQAQSQVQKQSQLQKQAEAQAQSQFQAQSQAQSQSQSEMERTVLGEAAARPRPRPPKPPKRAPRIIPPLLLPTLPEMRPLRKPVPVRREGYDAIVKVRGKPRNIAKNVSKISALSIGSSFVDARPAASFTIKKTGRVASGSDIFGWKARKFKFRPPIRRGKPVKSEIIIEKTKFRIDSPGEVAGIPLAKRVRRLT